jgi:hypothetical protein
LKPDGGITPFLLQQENVYGVPVLHYSMEFAAQVQLAFRYIQPTCIAVELPETLHDVMVRAAERLPDLSVVVADDLYFMCEPCDPLFEALRIGVEHQLPVSCIDLDVHNYPLIADGMPDPYAITRIGLRRYYEAYIAHGSGPQTELDRKREHHMAHRLRELSLRHERVLFIGGMFHILTAMQEMTRAVFPDYPPAKRRSVQLCTLTEKSAREVTAEPAWFSRVYEAWRNSDVAAVPDRQLAIYHLLKLAAADYTKRTGLPFEGYHLRNTMKFCRNYALFKLQLMPNLFQLLTAAKSCVDDNYACEVWELATSYPELRNIDDLPALDLTAQQVWGHSRRIAFRPKLRKTKGAESRSLDKSRRPFHFSPPSPFCICSHPPEDMRIERFGARLRERGTRIFSEETARTVPFTTSLEDGVDLRETIRHYGEKQLYVRINGKPPGPTGAVVVVFDTDAPMEGKNYVEQFPWRVTWHGEHEQESDMAFYSTPMTADPIGPGIGRCRYGGLMMTYPPRRLYDIWEDPEYTSCHNKAEILLMAAIDYAVDPVIVYVAATPPRRFYKQYAAKLGKQVAYLPIGQLSPVQLSRLRLFHVLDGHDKREIADRYIID